MDNLLDELGRRTPPLPGPLAPEMWRRIAQAQPAARESVWERVQAGFARPSFAAAFVAACMFLGLFLAEVGRSHRQSEYNRELMQSYLQMVDPLLKAADRTTFAPAPIQPGSKS